MNKTIGILASVVAVLGLGLAFIMKSITLEVFMSTSTAVVSLLWGIYNKYENKYLEEKIELFNTENEKMFFEKRKFEGMYQEVKSKLALELASKESQESKQDKDALVVRTITPVGDAIVDKPKKTRSKKK